MKKKLLLVALYMVVVVAVVEASTFVIGKWRDFRYEEITGADEVMVNGPLKEFIVNHHHTAADTVAIGFYQSSGSYVLVNFAMPIGGAHMQYKIECDSINVRQTAGQTNIFIKG